MVFGGLKMIGYWVAAMRVPATTRAREPVGAEGDAESTAFFERVWQLAVAATQSSVGTDDASDIASAVTIRLWRHRDRYPELMQSRDALDRFVIASARRMLLNHERNRRLRSVREQTYTMERSDGITRSDASTALTMEEMQTLVARVTDALPERTREAWHLVHRDGQTHAEAATAMGIAKQTVNVQLCRALNALREAFERYRREGVLPAPPPPPRAPLPRRSSTEDER